MAKILVAKGKKPHRKEGGIGEILEVSIGDELDKVLAKRLLEAVQLRAIVVGSGFFERGLAYLAQYIADGGSTVCPAATVYEDFKIGWWLVAQRTAYKNHNLSADKIAALERLGMTWSINDQRWEQFFADLVAFKHERGHVNVPNRSTLKMNAKWNRLATWVNAQRNQYDQGVLTSDRIQRLTEIGFSWDRHQERWERGLAAYRKYVQDTGNVNPNRAVEVDGVKLGTWLTDKRVKKANGLLPQDRVDELESIGVNWTPPNGNIERGIALLKAFKQREGHVMVPDSWVEDGFPLGEWLVNRRQFYKRGAIQPGHKLALDRLGMIWDVNQFKWDRAVAAMRAFLKTHELSEVVRGVHHNGVNLGSWRNNSMHSYRIGRLSEKQVRDLAALGFVDESLLSDPKRRK